MQLVFLEVFSIIIRIFFIFKLWFLSNQILVMCGNLGNRLVLHKCVFVPKSPWGMFLGFFPVVLKLMDINSEINQTFIEVSKFFLSIFKWVLCLGNFNNSSSECVSDKILVKYIRKNKFSFYGRYSMIRKWYWY